MNSLLVMLIYTVLWISLHFRDFDTILGAKRLLRSLKTKRQGLQSTHLLTALACLILFCPAAHKTSLKGRICRFGLYNSAWAWRCLTSICPSLCSFCCLSLGLLLPCLKWIPITDSMQHSCSRKMAAPAQEYAGITWGDARSCGVTWGILHPPNFQAVKSFPVSKRMAMMLGIDWPSLQLPSFSSPPSS